MMLAARIFYFLMAVFFARYLYRAVFLRSLWRLLFILSIEVYFLYYLLFDLYPASFKHYIWTGTLHWGPISLPPGAKPDGNWLCLLLFLLACIAFKWEEVQKKKRADVTQTRTSE